MLAFTEDQEGSQRPPKDQADRDRHEQFKAKLLEANLGRRRSLDLENAEAMTNAQGSGDEEERGDEEETGSSSKMKALKEKLTVKGKGKEKVKEVLGPSGKAYTPLEKQVSCIPV